MSDTELTVRDVLGIHFTDGEGALWKLDADLPGSALLAMTRREKALAKSLLELALSNVERAADRSRLE